jgi:hypothetical protein
MNNDSRSEQPSRQQAAAFPDASVHPATISYIKDDFKKIYAN